MSNQERDVMVCRACGNDDRASEGYPCVDCGTFLCLLCDLRGVRRCKTCEEKRQAALSQPPPPTLPPLPPLVK